MFRGILLPYTCQTCKGKISTSTTLSAVGGLMGLAVSGLYSAGYTVVASVSFFVILLVLLLIAPHKLTCTFEDDTHEKSKEK